MRNRTQGKLHHEPQVEESKHDRKLGDLNQRIGIHSQKNENPDQQNENHDQEIENPEREHKIDQQLEDSFPASDPPSYSQPGNELDEDKEENEDE